MKYRILIGAVLFIAAAVIVAGGCQCQTEDLPNIIRAIEFTPVNVALASSFTTSDKTRFKLNFKTKTINRTWKEGVRITNKSDLEVTVAGITFDGSPGPFSLADVPATVPAKGDAQFTVVYKPTADGSTDRAVVVVETKDTDIPKATVEVFGEGTKAEAIIAIDAPDPLDPAKNRTYICDPAASPPAINATIDFVQVPIGVQKNVTMTVRNTGPSPMNVTLAPDPQGEQNFGIVSPAPGADGKVTFTVQPDSAGQKVVVSFKPLSAGPKSENITVVANDINCKADNVISLIGKGITSLIQVCAESDSCPQDNTACICTSEGVDTIDISFGDVKQGTQAVKKIEISNIGDNAATITAIGLQTQGSNVYSIDKGAPPDQPLAAQSTFTVAVTYAPNADPTEPNAVEIKVETSVGKTESFTVNLHGASLPTLCVSPDGSLTFKAKPSQKETQQATVTNCGYGDLVIDNIEVDPNTGTPQSFALKGLPPFSKTVVAGDSFQFDVEFTNNPNVSNDTAQIMITSNDPYYNGASNPYYLTLFSDDDTSDMPPVAVCGSPGGDVQKAKETELPHTIDLDGSKSTDTDASGIASYEWKLLAVPKGSALTPNSSASITNSTSVAASFGADKFGKYTYQLTATDTIGQVSAPAVCTVTLIKDL